ncbi:hypothetical protein OURE66S_00324 [Oligella ureolytica]
MDKPLKDFNPFDYMETQADIQLFLEDCLSDDDPNTFIEALGLLIKKTVSLRLHGRVSD